MAVSAVTSFACRSGRIRRGGAATGAGGAGTGVNDPTKKPRHAVHSPDKAAARASELCSGTIAVASESRPPPTLRRPRLPLRGWQLPQPRGSADRARRPDNSRADAAMALDLVHWRPVDASKPGVD